MMKYNPNNILIALDDGHGMETAGKRTPKFKDGTFMHENEFNREVVRLLDINLRRCGFKTLLVAPTDDDTSLQVRVNTANTKKADIYISVHANALKGVWGNWGGIETYYKPKSNVDKELAESIHNHLMLGTQLNDRGVKTQNFYVLRKTKMPSVLVECAFMDNIREAELLTMYKYRKECADEIAKGICYYYKIPYVEESVTMFKDLDLSNRHKWGEESVKYFVENGLIKGDGQGNFSPDSPLTRLQAVVLLYRIIKHIKGKV